MIAGQRILRERRQYNKWANSQTLEDYALRFTAHKARRWSAGTVAGTALGATSFLACEAIGGTITLNFGAANAMAAIGAAMALMFLIGLPIAYHAAREGLDVDLLTRGASFGYLGSTITSLIYASFTFLLFAIEASILSAALELALGIPIALAHVLSALVVVPITLYGMQAITRMQLWTQPLWIALQIAPAAYLIWRGDAVEGWRGFTGRSGAPDGSVDLLPFGLAFSTLLSLLPQIGEQADYLRFLPARERIGRTRWWVALIASGPGWVVVGGAKLALGSLLVVFALSQGVAPARADDPTEMFLAAFRGLAGSPGLALTLTVVLVIVAQTKINVTNAYAGSIAWSNFFSRLTHAHPGRVVWLVFNALLALMLMELGILRVISGILILYADLAAAWIGALAADLVISKPLGLSPKGIEFKRAHLYDINPVGVGAVALSILVSTLALGGMLGPLAQAFAPLIGLAVAFVAGPTIALATRGRFYIARAPDGLPEGEELACTICENAFERADMAYCPAYAGSICSLCCTLEARCHDMCKVDSSVAEQTTRLLERLLPRRLAASINTTLGHFVAVGLLFGAAIGTVLWLVYLHYAALAPGDASTIATTLWIAFIALFTLAIVCAWLLVLAHDSRRAAERDTAHQTAMLRAEIAAHGETDRALQKAKEAAEAANQAKTRYLVAASHELRSPLNAIYGYAQLLERQDRVSAAEAAGVIRRSSEHLTNLIEGLLEISRVESGLLKLNRDVVHLPELLAELVDMFRAQAAEKGLELRFTAAGRLPPFVRTDEKRLRQILINLLSNAVKYTPTGHAELRIAYRSQVAQIDMVDTGIGIRREDQQHIFEPFERGNSPEALAQPGIGLGLAISRVLARIMGGELTVKSEPGAGSRFTLRLMLPEPITPPEAIVRADIITGYEGDRRAVLLVDDDPAQLAILSSLLRPLGFEVEVAANGAAGLALAEARAFDVVLLDIQMPGQDGWATAARLRERCGAALRIVMVSANAHEFADGGDGRAAHDAFVTKPVEFQKLLDTLAVQLGLRWTSAAPVAPRPRDPTEAAQPDPPLPPALLADLTRLGRIGHVRGITRKLDELEAALPAARPLVDRLRERVDAFDLAAYLRILEGKQDG